MKLITLYIPEPLLEKIKELVDKDYFPHVAEALRVGARTTIYEHVKFGHIKRPLHKETPAEKNPYNQSLENLFKL